MRSSTWSTTISGVPVTESDLTRVPEARVVIYANSNVSRGKFAAAAVHAALTAAGAHPGLPVIVLGAKPGDIENLWTVIHDAGRTEVEPGTVTAGTDWRPAHRATEPDEDCAEPIYDAIWDALEPRLEDVIDLDLNEPADSAVFRILVGQVRDAVLRALPGAVPDEDNWEYAAGYQNVDGRWFAMHDDWYTIREAAEGFVREYADPQIVLIRRRQPGAAGPAEPVTPIGEKL